MSLDVYLEDGEPYIGGSGIFVRENGRMRELIRAEWDERFPGCEPVVATGERGYIYNGNITHNLSRMAEAAGIYDCLWQPETIGITKASELVEPLTFGLKALKDDPEYFKRLNPENRWGTYEGLVRFVAEYLDACKANPTCAVRVWR